jgi:hypothetical protein
MRSDHDRGYPIQFREFAHRDDWMVEHRRADLCRIIVADRRDSDAQRPAKACQPLALDGSAEVMSSRKRAGSKAGWRRRRWRVDRRHAVKRHPPRCGILTRRAIAAGGQPPLLAWRPDRRPRARNRPMPLVNSRRIPSPVVWWAHQTVALRTRIGKARCVMPAVRGTECTIWTWQLYFGHGLRIIDGRPSRDCRWSPRAG